MNRARNITLSILTAIGLLLAMAAPAQASYGNEDVYNRCTSERGLYVYNNGYKENMLLLGPCGSSAAWGWADTDYIYISKEDICFRAKTASGSYGPSRSGIGDYSVGENTLYVETGTVSWGGWDPGWFCNYAVNGV